MLTDRVLRFGALGGLVIAILVAGVLLMRAADPYLPDSALGTLTTVVDHDRTGDDPDADDAVSGDDVSIDPITGETLQPTIPVTITTPAPTTPTTPAPSPTTTLPPPTTTTQPPDDAPPPTTTTTTIPPPPDPDPALAAGYRARVPSWVVFPGQNWLTAGPRKAGLDAPQWKAYVEGLNPRVETVSGLHREHPDEWGVVVTRAGYVVYTAGDPDAVYQSGSVGKTFTRLALLIAEKKGLIDSVDDPVAKYWKGDGSDGPSLSSPAKFMNNGFNAEVTFKDLAFHTGGFRVSNGGAYSGNPFADMYAMKAPGDYHYSSGGMWRLSQALTYVFGEELKTVLDRELFRFMGIEADDWDWISGGAIFADRDFWPVFNKGGLRYYGRFIDPPYYINGARVVGGGGWVEMSPLDLARVALLIATDGYWDGRQLISPLDSNRDRGVGSNHYLGNHSGYGGSRIEGDSRFYTASAWLRTEGFRRPQWGDLVIGPPQP